MSLIPPESLAGGPGAVLSITAARLGREDQLLVVDDAQFLDSWSCVLLQQLMEGTPCRVAVTVRTTDPVPDAVARLWESGAMERVDLGPFDRADTAALAASELRGELDGESASRLWRLTRGNPLFTKEVIHDARSSGDLAVTDGTWHFERQSGPGARLVDLIGRRLGPLDGSERRVVALVALGEPVAWTVLSDIAGREPLARGLATGLVTRRRDGRREMVWLGHPLYGDVVRSLLEPEERSELANALLEALEVHGARRRQDLGSGAVLALESGQWHRVDLLARAADQAVDLDPALAERLASAALTQGPHGLASAVLARRASRNGEFDLTEKHARAVLDDESASDRAKARAADALASALMFLRLDLPAASSLAQGVLDDIGPAAGAELAARLAQVHAISGNVDEVRRVTDSALPADLPAPARMRLVHARAMVDALGGRTRAAIDLTSAHVELARGQARTFVSEAGDLAMAHTIAQVVSGRFDDARESTADIAAADDMGMGWADILNGIILLEQGDVRVAGHTLLAGARAAQSTIAGFRASFALSLASQALALAGEVSLAAELLQEAVARLAGPLLLGANNVAQAEALVAATGGERTRAVDVLVGAAIRAFDAGLFLDALRSLHLALRLGAPWSALTMTEDIVVDGTVGPTMRDHVFAMRDGDPDRALAAAGRFEQAGTRLRAGEAYLQAAALLEQHGRARSATDARSRGRGLIQRCEAKGPTVLEINEATPLTRREREIVEMAAAGLSNKSIAERLTVGVRTVEGHLHRAYVKLGVTSRAELVERFRA